MQMGFESYDLWNCSTQRLNCPFYDLGIIHKLFGWWYIYTLTMAFGGWKFYGWEAL